jgi:hypothetical protein
MEKVQYRAIGKLVGGREAFFLLNGVIGAVGYKDPWAACCYVRDDTKFYGIAEVVPSIIREGRNDYDFSRLHSLIAPTEARWHADYLCPAALSIKLGWHQKEAAMNKRGKERLNRLLPGGKPRYIRCYDNGGESYDRYTVVYTGRYRHKTGGAQWHVGMSAEPFHPQGFGQHGESMVDIDWPTYGHLGKKIKFDDLPEDCQNLVMSDYLYLWDLPGGQRDES